MTTFRVTLFGLAVAGALAVLPGLADSASSEFTSTGAEGRCTKELLSLRGGDAIVNHYCALDAPECAPDYTCAEMAGANCNFGTEEYELMGAFFYCQFDPEAHNVTCTLGLKKRDCKVEVGCRIGEESCEVDPLSVPTVIQRVPMSCETHFL